MIHPPLSRRLGAEFFGTAALLATVVGSGIMGQRLSGGNDALALLSNTLPTGAILIVLITMLGPISGAHFNPAVTMTFLLRVRRQRGCRIRAGTADGRSYRSARCPCHV
jgi:glycerol uptake facilitator-like aquaporin